MHFMPYRLAQANCQPEDDIDKLFSHLPQIEPSGELITRILSYVRKLPGPSALPLPAQQTWLDSPASEEQGTLVVHNEMREPS